MMDGKGMWWVTVCVLFFALLLGEVSCDNVVAGVKAGVKELKVKVGEIEKRDRKVDGESVNHTRFVDVNHSKMTTRVKRYPEHLDPNYPFWVRIGECPTSVDGNKQHFCPTPTAGGRWVCVDDYQLCDGVKNCPNAEDESSNYCLFYRVLKSEVDMLTRSITTLTKVEDELSEGGVVVGTFDDGNSRTESNGEDENDEAFVNRFHRQSGRFIPAN